MDRQRALDPVLGRFAGRLRQDIGAERVLLFGSHARGNAYHDSDYDFIVVSPRFAGADRFQRGSTSGTSGKTSTDAIPSTSSV
ncbi:MAG: nucleotidyltransferase domain-containing protein [Chloroflexi bacterium]|nr:nucleotidyltransferase domain-containing protein [Chloroflexota bacterium]